MHPYPRRRILRQISSLLLCLAAGAAGGAHASILSTDVEKTPVDAAPLTIIVPGDPGIVRSTAHGLIRDLGVQDRWTRATRNGFEMSYSILNEQNNGRDFVVHARVSNGTTGSGVKYTVRYQLTDSKDGGYSVQLTPLDRGTYQQGLIGKYAVPDFTDADLRNHLLDNGLAYKFEVNSSYPTESVNGNFMRLASPVNMRAGEADEVSGKIFKNRFAIPFGDKKIYFTIEIFPYRNGSKIVAYARVPALETSPGVADYTILLANAKRQLEAIAQD
ncbi:hypothetical protein [Duganella levis]|uniref:DUF3108 domain-containing protein n=1 Tax=Duganella levis TaxID=2692169 RepID=A0ABW9VZJ7_9BURK|nr:hypothetical protein [Duganella levis]MYN26940.1 hypothetical protein [Duganella levis]